MTEQSPEPKSDAAFTIKKSHLKWALFVVVAVVVVMVGKHYYNQSETSDQTSGSKADIAAEVKTSMQDTLNTDPAFSKYHLQVVKVDVVKKSDNQYEGIAVVHGAKQIDHNVSVQVTADGDKAMWQSPPGSFAWAAVEQLDTTAPVPTFAPTQP